MAGRRRNIGSRKAQAFLFDFDVVSDKPGIPTVQVRVSHVNLHWVGAGHKTIEGNGGVVEYFDVFCYGALKRIFDVGVAIKGCWGGDAARAGGGSVGDWDRGTGEF